MAGLLNTFDNTFQNSVIRGRISARALESGNLRYFLNNLIYPYIIPVFFYVLLAPGLVLSLPPTTNKKCNELIPLPTNCRGKCWDGDYKPASGSPTDPCTDVLVNRICNQQNRCNSIGMSKTVTFTSALVHGIVYTVGFNMVLYFVTRFVNRVMTANS
jgi:hypothetical protein